MNIEGIVSLPITEYRDLVVSVHNKVDNARAGAASSDINRIEYAQRWLGTTYPKVTVTGSTDATIFISMGKWNRLNQFESMSIDDILATINK